MKKNNRQIVIDKYQGRIEKLIEYAYSDGYVDGLTSAEDDIVKMRASCQRIAGEYDEKYADAWDDHTDFYGWCNQCEHPHSGRFAHMWDFCPWCGAKIDFDHEQPYPGGYKGKEDAK